MPETSLKSSSDKSRPSLKLGRNNTSTLFAKLLSQVSTDHLSKLKDIIDVGWKLSLIAGLLWNGVYYAFIVKALPNINLSALPAVLVGTFLLGCLLTVLFVTLFFLPGLLLRSAIPKDYGEKQLKAWRRLYAGFFFALGLVIFMIVRLMPRSGNIIETAAPIGVGTGVAFLAVAITVVVWRIGAMEAVLAEDFRTFLEVGKQESRRLSWVLATVAWISPMLISLLAGHLLASSPDSASLASYGFGAVLLVAAVTNHSIATEQRHPLLITMGFFGLSLIFLLSMITPADRHNIFLTAPYRILKIGQIQAHLTLEPSFEQRSPIFEECGLKKNPTRTYDLFVIDSVGSEYMVKCDSLDKNNGKQKNRLVKIPKKAVLQAMYIDQ